MPRFRFTIRDVLWLTLVVGLVVGWWTDRTRLARECRGVQGTQIILVDSETLEPIELGAQP